MPAGDVFGLDGFFLNKSNPVVVSTIGINSTGVGAGIAVTAGTFSAGTVTLNLSNAAGLSTTPFYTGAKIAVSGLANAGTAYPGYNGTFVVTGFAGTTTVSYATTGYVGGVTASISGQTGTVMLVTDSAVTNTTWSSVQTHGWFGGGGASLSQVSTVDRIDFSNDTGTANIRGPLSFQRQQLAATGNSNYGWFGGGYFDGPITSIYNIVDRIDFSNDATTASPRGSLSDVRKQLAATGNSNYGWFGGGSTQPAAVATVDRIDFSNDSGTLSSRGPLSSARKQLAATGNSNYGWFGGGLPALSTVDRIDFSNDSTTASVRGPLSNFRDSLAATGNSNYGWFGGGYFPSSPVSRIDRIDFSNDSAIASVRGSLIISRRDLAATGNSNYGWFGGGIVFPSSYNTVERIDFSNDSASVSPRGPLSSPSGTAKLGATSGQAKGPVIKLTKTAGYGWFGGGFAPSVPGKVATVDRIDFSNDSVSASPRGSLSLAKYGAAATGNSNYGWFGGGNTFPSPTVATVDRINFSNDSATALARGPLSSARGYLSATGNSNYGWFNFATVPALGTDRIDFSNDSSLALVRGLLNKGTYAATANSNYGWFGGGGPSLAIDRINFSNDSATALARGPLSLAKDYLAATGNSNYGWFGGGFFSTTASSRVERIDFSNDSPSALIRGSLNAPAGRRNLAATGNSNYGWFGGGFAPTPATFSTVDRIDFSNDTVTGPSLTKGSLSQARSSLSATSNTQFS
jgi:hypothetical protein